jgi:hypothetical protein
VVYPIRPLLGMDGEYRDAWGGPTLAGAWAVHALGGLAFWLLVPWVLRAYATLWQRITGGRNLRYRRSHRGEGRNPGRRRKGWRGYDNDRICRQWQHRRDRGAPRGGGGV